MNKDNHSVNDLALQYFGACDSAEKTLHNYQEIKLMTAMSFDKRQGIYDKVLNTLELCKQKELNYKETLPKCNERLTAYVELLEKQRDRFLAIENKRCEAVHSAIG